MTTKTKRQDAYQARLVVTVPLDLANASSYSDAVEAVKEIKLAIPGATVEIVSASLCKVAAAEPAPLAKSVTPGQDAGVAELPNFLNRRKPAA